MNEDPKTMDKYEYDSESTSAIEAMYLAYLDEVRTGKRKSSPWEEVASITPTPSSKKPRKPRRTKAERLADEADAALVELLCELFPAASDKLRETFATDKPAPKKVTSADMKTVAQGALLAAINDRLCAEGKQLGYKPYELLDEDLDDDMPF